MGKQWQQGLRRAPARVLAEGEVSLPGRQLEKELFHTMLQCPSPQTLPSVAAPPQVSLPAICPVSILPASLTTEKHLRVPRGWAVQSEPGHLV